MIEQLLLDPSEVTGFLIPWRSNMQLLLISSIDFHMQAAEVTIFDYTLHWLQGNLTAKMGSSCIIRRAHAGCSLLVALFRSSKIVAVSSEALSQLMQMNGVQMRKNATKASKIRALMRLEAVAANCKRELLDKVEAFLAAAEDGRAKRKKKDPGDNGEEDEDADEASI